jgi:hypothetical protein
MNYIENIKSHLPKSSNYIEVFLPRGDALLIPYRTYSLFNLYIDDIGIAKAHYGEWLVNLLYYDGYERQRYLVLTLKYFNIAPSLAVAFYAKLLSEYVIEIHYEIMQLKDEIMSYLVEFAINNMEYFKLVRQRAVSYWVCYYGTKETFTSSPALMIIDEVLELVNKRIMGR